MFDDRIAMTTFAERDIQGTGGLPRLLRPIADAVQADAAQTGIAAATAV